MAYPTSPPFDKARTDMVYVVWWKTAKDGYVTFVPKGKVVPKDGEVIFASNAEDGNRRQAEDDAFQQLHRWRVAHGTHLKVLW